MTFTLNYKNLKIRLYYLAENLGDKYSFEIKVKPIR